MLYILQNTPVFVAFIGALVFFHELGHFLLAKLCNIKVLKFSLGFGPRLFGFTRGETEYVVSALPFGGYVKMLGEFQAGDLDPTEEPRSFNRRPLYQRAAVVLAGPVFNFLLAFLVYVYLFVGPQTFGSTRLGVVAEGQPAWKAGMRPGDKVLAIDGEPVETWEELRKRISSRPGETLSIAYEREDQRVSADVSTAVETTSNVFRELEQQGRVGVSLQYIRTKIAIVDPASPAARSGLQTDDLIISVGDTPVEAWHELRRALQRFSAGEPVPVTYSRDGVEATAIIAPEQSLEEVPSSLFSSADAAGGYTGLVSKDVIVTAVDQNTPAEEIGLRPGDRLLSFVLEREGQARVKHVEAWDVDLAAITGVGAHSKITLNVQRGREVLTKQLQLIERTQLDELKNKRKVIVFGASNDLEASAYYTFEREVGLVEAMDTAIRRVGTDMTLISTGLSKFFSKIVRGQIKADDLNDWGGPVVLFVIAEKSAKRGLNYFLGVMALISVNLGLVNLLPVPVLDGGSLVFIGIEAVRRRPPSLRVRELAHLAGLALLMLLMLAILANDLLRLVPWR